MTQSKDLLPIDSKDLRRVTGGFDIAGLLDQAIGIAGNLVDEFGDDKARRGMAMAANIAPRVLGMASQFMTG